MISIIVAVAKNGVIGCHNRLIWHMSEDLKRFKALTIGHPIIMGRKTFESIGRPLPGRTNIVVSRNTELKIDGVSVVGSIQEAIDMLPQEDEIFIIGGGQIYEQALPLTSKIYLTLVDQTPDGDTFFPEITQDEWREVKRTEADGYAFIDYERRSC